MQKPLFKIGLENRSAAFALSASYIATMILRKSVTHTGKKIRILVRCSYSITPKDADFFIHIIRGENPQKRRLPPDLVSIGLYAQDGTQFRGYLLPPPGAELSSRAIAFSSRGGTQFQGAAFSSRGGRNSVPGVPASSSRGGTQFQGYRFLLPGRNSVPGCCFLLPGWNSVPGYLLPPPRLELSSGVTAFSSQNGTQFQGYLLFLPGWNSVPGLSAFSSQGGTQFRGICFLLPGGTPFRIPHLMSAGLYDQDGTQFQGYRFLLPGRSSVPGCCFLLPGWNSVPG